MSNHINPFLIPAYNLGPELVRLIGLDLLPKDLRNRADNKIAPAKRCDTKEDGGKQNTAQV